MKKYRQFSVNDFALDDSFQCWVLNPDEHTEAIWRAWLQEHPEKLKEVLEAREILGNFGLPKFSLSASEVSELWTRTQQEGLPHQAIQNEAGTIRWYWAAAAIVILGMAVAVFQFSNNKIEYQTAFGETKSILLPDSSTVILNANSRLAFHRHLEKQSVREIWLEGEAYFSVVHKQNNQPFKVSTPGGVAVEVLGTTFNVYNRSIDTKVVLNSGQIRLSLPSAGEEEKKILMKPGELVEYKDDRFSKRLVDPRIYAAWTEKKLILNQTSLGEMIRMAGDNYGLEIEVTSKKMLEQTVSGSMPIGDKENFVNQMAKIFQLKVVKDEEKFLLTE